MNVPQVLAEDGAFEVLEKPAPTNWFSPNAQVPVSVVTMYADIQPSGSRSAKG